MNVHIPSDVPKVASKVPDAAYSASANVPDVPSSATAFQTSGDPHVSFFVGDEVSSIIEEEEAAIKRKGDSVSVTGSIVEPTIKRQKSEEENID